MARIVLSVGQAEVMQIWHPGGATGNDRVVSSSHATWRRADAGRLCRSIGGVTQTPWRRGQPSEPETAAILPLRGILVHVRQPLRPAHLSEHAERTLHALAGAGLGHATSLGGALGLLHYLDYRSTHDVDAWWAPSVSAKDRERVLQVIREALQTRGDIRTRQWGEVVSIESLPDLVASKMVALVERGAPRDFRDIYALCRSGLMTAGECWSLWRLRQQRAGSDTDAHRARLALSTHLSRIAQHRPLADITDPDQRAEAASLRTWFTTELLDALVD